MHLVKCPSCAKEVKVPDTASLATCPNCLNTFRADYAADDEDEEEAPEARAPVRKPGLSGALPAATRTAPAAAQAVEEDAEEGQAAWISPWGSAAFGVAAMALLQASVLGLWWLTVLLALCGVLLFVQGVWATRQHRRTKDRVWLVLGGGVSGAALIVALLAPGLLNNYWAKDIRVPPPDLDTMIVVPRDEPGDDGRRLPPDEWANGVKEAIRQEDVFVRIESVKKGTAPKGGGAALLVHLRLSNSKMDRVITLEGFKEHAPVMTDESGRTYKFIDQWLRKPAKGAPVFEPSSRMPELKPSDRQDYLLYFAAPAGRIENLKLELPATAWGRKGVCRFRISGLFEAQVKIGKTL